MDSYVGLTTFLVLAGYLFLIFLNAQAGIGPDSQCSLGWFNHSTCEIAAKYPTPVTPAGYTFGIWGLVYLWNFAWIVYIITTLFRKNRQGLQVYLNPPATSVMFLLVFFLSNVSNGVWLFLVDRELLGQAAAGLLLVTLTLHLCLQISLGRVYRFLSFFENYAQSDLWAYRVLVHNGIALYAAWTAIATVLNVSVVFIYDLGICSETTVYVALTSLACVLLIFFVFDLFVVDVYTRYVFMVYPTFIWALAGIMVANQADTSSPAFIYSAVLVSIAGVFFIVKTVFMIIREPVYLLVKRAEAEAAIYIRIKE